MHRIHTTAQSFGDRFAGTPASLHARRFAALVALFFGAAALWLAAGPGIVFAAAPPAGTVIGSTASATYNDSLGTARTATSNTVQTVVQQVASATVVAAQTKPAVPGGTVTYPHTLTNTGNGVDTFTLSTTNSGAFTMTSVAIYADNGSGQPTGPAITTTGSLAIGATFKFVVVGTLPGVVVAGQTNTIVATATSTFDATKTATVSDTTTVTLDAVVGVTAAISAASGAPGSGPHTITLTYTNSGGSLATNVRLTDAIPTGLTYVAGSGRWSVTGATALTDASGDAQGTLPTIDYSVTGATVVANISQVGPGQTGSLTFQVNVSAGAPAGTVNDVASLQYVTTLGNTVTGTSNTVTFTIAQVAGVTVTAPPATAYALPGSTVSFTDTVQNTGNASDRFNVTYLNATTNGFPAGTTFALFRADGVTPLTDTNADGTVDTGLVAAGASIAVVVKATLPANTTGGPFNVTTTATSVFDASKTGSGIDTVTSVAAATVDLTAGAGLGSGAGPEASPVTSATVSAGANATLPVVVTNTSPLADAYDLAASTSSSFASISLPTGWTAVFRADLSSNCTSLGGTVTATGTIAAGAAARFCLVVSVPSTGAGALAGATEIYVRGLSPGTGAADTLHDRVTVNAARALTFAPNGTGQAVPGGAVVYVHTLTNSGNAVEGNGTSSTVVVTSADSRSGYVSAAYYDANGNGALDAGDPLIPAGGLAAIPALAAGLAPGASITILEKVTAPAGAVAGEIDATTVTVTTTNGSGPGSAPAAATVTESTTIVLGSTVTLVKEQALDATCSGTPGAYSQGTLTTGAVPNACIRYRVTATNVGTVAATSVVLTDPTPAYTSYDTGNGSAPAATTVGTISAPAAGSAGTITVTVSTLGPSASVVVTFGVRIQP